MELAYRLAIEETPFIQDNPQQRDRRAHAGVGGGRPREGRRRPARARSGTADPGMAYWGHYVQHDNNRDGIGKGLKLTQQHAQDLSRLASDRVPRPARVGDLLYVSTGTGPYNPIVDPIQVDRVVVARAERDHGDDEARRAGRVDVRLLRRLGAELPVLDRRHAQLDRPVLRDAELRAAGTACAADGGGRRAASGIAAATRTSRGATWRRVDAASARTRMVSVEPNPGTAVERAKHQHAGSRSDHDEHGREEQGEVPRELLR